MKNFQFESSLTNVCRAFSSFRTGLKSVRGTNLSAIVLVACCFFIPVLFSRYQARQNEIEKRQLESIRQEQAMSGIKEEASKRNSQENIASKLATLYSDVKGDLEWKISEADVIDDGVDIYTNYSLTGILLTKIFPVVDKDKLKGGLYDLSDMASEWKEHQASEVAVVERQKSRRPICFGDCR